MIQLEQLRPSGMEFGKCDAYEDDTLNIIKAVGKGTFGMNEDTLKSRLSRVHQLTGFSDPVYAEACVRYVTLFLFLFFIFFLCVFFVGSVILKVAISAL